MQRIKKIMWEVSAAIALKLELKRVYLTYQLDIHISCNNILPQITYGAANTIGSNFDVILFNTLRLLISD